MNRLLLLLPLLLAGCASGVLTLTQDLATGACVTLTTGSLSVTSASGNINRQSETVVFCPPSVVANAAPPAASAIGPGLQVPGVSKAP